MATVINQGVVRVPHRVRYPLYLGQNVTTSIVLLSLFLRSLIFVGGSKRVFNKGLIYLVHQETLAVGGSKREHMTLYR